MVEEIFTMEKKSKNIDYKNQSSVEIIVNNNNANKYNFIDLFDDDYFVLGNTLVIRSQIKNREFINDVDALSGRGVLYPISSLIKTKGLRPNLFPHYLADYELSLRVKKNGYKLLISMRSIVYSDENFDLIRKIRKKENIIPKLFSKKSPSLFYSNFLFWWQASKLKGKLCLPFRIIIFIMLSALKKK